MSYPNTRNVHRKEMSKFAILCEYYKNGLSDEKVVLKYRINNKQLLFQ
jgi:hypothetical protein